jgi:hypothetical protein
VIGRLGFPALVALASAVLAGCGGGGDAVPSGHVNAVAHGFLPAVELERELGDGFRKSLYRLAVMGQDEEEAVDLGQPLPTGRVEGVRCNAAGPKPALAHWRWRCMVRWETRSGASRRMGYSVHLIPGGCFTAAADSPLPPRHDSTIKTYSEDPRNVLGSVRRGC